MSESDARAIISLQLQCVAWLGGHSGNEDRGKGICLNGFSNGYSPVFHDSGPQRPLLPSSLPFPSPGLKPGPSGPWALGLWHAGWLVA